MLYYTRLYTLHVYTYELTVCVCVCPCVQELVVENHLCLLACLPPQECSRECQWVSELGAVYSLQDFTDKVFQSTISNLKGSSFQFTLCLPSLNCNGQPSPTCLSVPGWKLTTTGRTVSVDPLEPNAPGQGFKLVLSEGDECEMTGRPRITIIHLPCNPNARYTAEQLKPSRASEGARENLCRYTVEFPASQFGCPVVSGGVRDGPQLTAGMKVYIP